MPLPAVITQNLRAGDETSHIPLHVLDQFFAMVQRSGGDDDMSLLAYHKAHPGNLGSLGYAVMSSPTVRDALACIVDFHYLIGTGFCMFLDEQPRTVKIAGFAEDLNDAELPRAFIDGIASMTLGLIHWLVPRRKIMPVFAEFTYARPADTRALESLFGPELRFSAENNSLAFSHEDGNLPTATSNQSLQAIHSDHLAVQPRQVMTDKMGARTKSAVLKLLNQTQPLTLETIAHTMKLTPYQLTQALELEGKSIRKFIDVVRSQQSHQLLTSTQLSLKQISYRVAFKNQSAFNKACERWFGMPPGRYRASHRPDIDSHSD
ncbi:AraC family transcriptional regulator [Pseudomonas alliivorans]|uniref:AraC family transcriptional regulator n=1 Tax=Pseudomonas alliivorans TaxID=2810613 RepID=UPI00211C65B9|nr:AraC family transcriptional regulator [Pseudomonas alliivorans]